MLLKTKETLLAGRRNCSNSHSVKQRTASNQKPTYTERVTSLVIAWWRVKLRLLYHVCFQKLLKTQASDINP